MQKQGRLSPAFFSAQDLELVIFLSLPGSYPLLLFLMMPIRTANSINGDAIYNRPMSKNTVLSINMKSLSKFFTSFFSLFLASLVLGGALEYNLLIRRSAGKRLLVLILSFRFDLFRIVLFAFLSIRFFRLGSFAIRLRLLVLLLFFLLLSLVSPH